MTDSRDLLFELGTEELPPGSLKTLQAALQANFIRELEKARLTHGPVTAYAAPRRLALSVEALAPRQPDRQVEKRGPAVQAAYRDDGTPTKAAEGFARSCNTTLDQLQTLKTDKGEWLMFRENVAGASSESLLPELLEASLAALPIAKRMRWGASEIEFVRPVHWCVLLFGEDVVPARVLGLESGRCSHGHRFHHPAPIELQTPADYIPRLRETGKVMVDFAERRRLIETQAQHTAKELGGRALIDEDLLDEIAALVEWPVAVSGGFDQRYLALPSEVLITTMQSNQKYFPVVDEAGRLLPHFITFSNIESSRPQSIRDGNQRVIRPRLADAEFFWNQDRKNTLESRVVALSRIVFQKQLGTLADKTRRVERLAHAIAEQLGVDSAPARHAAILAKTDLLTEMVGEFPGLQGTMGRYYALADGENAEVAAAIEEQYLPKQAGGPLPQTLTGQILALAEKTDTVVGIFSAGLIPTGDKDPYALRRAALGVLRIIIEQRVDLALPELLAAAVAGYDHEFDAEMVSRQVDEFFLERLRGYCLDQGYSHDEFDAVAALTPPRPLDFVNRLEAVHRFRALPEADSLASANKRIRNILKKCTTPVPERVDPDALVQAEEIHLLTATQEAARMVQPLLAQGAYSEALSQLAHLRDSVDRFFDEVMVMAEDPGLRDNRLALLALIESLFLRTADISRLQPPNA